MTATYATQYQLTISSSQGNPACPGAADPGGCWYDAGMQGTATVTNPFFGPDGKRYELVGWSGDATGTGSTVLVIMDGPKSVTATWREAPLYFESPSALRLTVLLGGIAIAVFAGLATWLILRVRRKAPPPPTWPGYPPR